VQACVLQSCDAYWLPTPFSCFPFTSPPLRQRVPSHFNWTLLLLRFCLVTSKQQNKQNLHENFFSISTHTHTHRFSYGTLITVNKFINAFFRLRMDDMLNYTVKTAVKFKKFSVAHKNTKFSDSCIKFYFWLLTIYNFYTTAMFALVPVRHLNAQCDVTFLNYVLQNKPVNFPFHPEEGGSSFLRKVHNDVKVHRLSYFRVL
jgi:hypothetical protein